MMQRVNPIYFFLFIAPVFWLGGCYVESAKPIEDKQLVIVSDYLRVEDTLLFQKFEEKHKVDVIIRSMNANELIGYMRNARHNSGLDIIMMKSLYDVLHLQKQDVLHQFGANEKMFNLDTSFISTNYNFAGIGFDPFMVYRANDTSSVIKKVTELSKIEHYSALSKKSEIVLLSELRRKVGRATFYSWGKNWIPKSHNLQIEKVDSLTNPGFPVLGLFSDVKSIDSLSNNIVSSSFINDDDGRNPYNLRTICIINQSEHYTLARKFISFYRNPGHNDDLSLKLDIIPLFFELSERTFNFTPNTVNPEKQMQYYTITERIINKLDD